MPPERARGRGALAVKAWRPLAVVGLAGALAVAGGNHYIGLLAQLDMAGDQVAGLSQVIDAQERELARLRPACMAERERARAWEREARRLARKLAGWAEMDARYWRNIHEAKR